MEIEKSFLTSYGILNSEDSIFHDGINNVLVEKNIYSRKINETYGFF